MLEESTLNEKKILRSASVSGFIQYHLLNEVTASLCRVNHNHTLMQKIINSKHLRSWETHKLLIGKDCLTSKTPRGYMVFGLSYSKIEEVRVSAKKSDFSLYVGISGLGSLLFQLNSIHERDSFYFTLRWKIVACRFKRLPSLVKKPNELSTAVKDLVNICLTLPISSAEVYQTPITAISSLLLHHGHEMDDSLIKKCVENISPLLELTPINLDICNFLQQLTSYHSNLELHETFLPLLYRMLKHNTKRTSSHLEHLLMNYVQHLNTEQQVQQFILSLHTKNTICPHPRLLHNIVNTCLAVASLMFCDKPTLNAIEKINLCNIITMFKILCQYDDWLPDFSMLLQYVPFPQAVFQDEDLVSGLTFIIKTFVMDKRCKVHRSVLRVHGKKPGWVDHFAPGGALCKDNGEFFSFMLSHLMPCCCKRKMMLVDLVRTMKHLFIMMAMRGEKYSIQALVSILDLNVVTNEAQRLEIISALQTTELGKKECEQLYKERLEFLRMKHSGGPYSLVLPSSSTDEDLRRTIERTSFGNLHTLNLAFTSVTSECAKSIVKLPNIQHLNFWSTCFGDSGLELISEKLHNLRSINLCETCVTDQGISSLKLLPKLTNLNLNSTKITQSTYDDLKEVLPDLYIDVTYTNVI